MRLKLSITIVVIFCMAAIFFQNNIEGYPEESSANLHVQGASDTVNNLTNESHWGGQKIDNETAGVKTTVKTSVVSNELSLPSWLTDAELDEIEQFEKSRGHGLTKENSDINNYDIKTLEMLAGSGDLRVLHALAQKYALSGEKDKELITYTQAAIHGSTEALISIANAYSQGYFLDNAASDDEKKVAAHTVLGFYQAALLRGDSSVLPRAEAFIAVNSIKLNENDRTKISEVGKSVFNALEARRSKLGLEPFDNNIPESAQKYLSIFQNYSINNSN